MTSLSSCDIERAVVRFKELLIDQLRRIEAVSTHYGATTAKTDVYKIGICYGDGIGPHIVAQAESVLAFLLRTEIDQGNVILQPITGLTLENRLLNQQAVPADILAQIKSCNVLLKGPTTTPQQGDGRLNIESANVVLRKELDLFANIRPILVPKENIQWHFFRENTEGEYALGSQGIVLADFAIDFKVTSIAGTKRICRAAFEFAKEKQLTRVTVVTKSNIIKATDGLFSKIAKEMAKEYEDVGITCDEYYIDIMAAHLINPLERQGFQVVLLPNLYGDILTDEAAQVQGGVGTAGSANVGTKYAMFEAVHGSAPKLVQMGLVNYASPVSILRATIMLLDHGGYTHQARRLEAALDIASLCPLRGEVSQDKKTTNEMFIQYLFSLIENKDILQEHTRLFSESV